MTPAAKPSHAPLPYGVRDLFFEDAAGLAALGDTCREIFARWGYTQVITPTYEHYDVLLRGYGADQEADLYRVLDREGAVLALRPDITTQVARLAGATGRCVLVEAFNHILITRIAWSDFPRGIPIFIEKDDLLPFEEAKLYGHNATHALMGYLARRKGYATMAEIRRDPQILDLARSAFLQESGAALIRKHGGLDPLFTEAGYHDYAEDLLCRMINPHLRDLVERVVRDPRRKLGWDDRLVGTMRLALGQGITPRYYALGARAALAMLHETEHGQNEEQLLDALWAEAKTDPREKQQVKELILQSKL